MADHVHLAIRLSRTITIAGLVEQLKADSSKWLKSQAPGLEAFAWQRGYACFSIGPKDLNALVDYIGHQREHHKVKTFQEELRLFLNNYGVSYEEAYVWD
jgi:REP element-mobilizing transposase RayT